MKKLPQKNRSLSVGSGQPRKVRRTNFKEGHVYSKVLYYCAAPGLIAVGVLPKPPLWDHHRQLFPQNLRTEDKEKLEKINIVSIKRNRKGNEIIELGEDDDAS